MTEIRPDIDSKLVWDQGRNRELAKNKEINDTFAVVLSLWESIDPMLPLNVDIASKRKQHAVALREINTRTVLRVKKGEFAFSTKGYAYCNILIPSTLRVVRGRVMVEGLPVTGIAVPIESSCLTARLDFKVLRDPRADLLVSRAALGVL